MEVAVYTLEIQFFFSPQDILLLLHFCLDLLLVLHGGVRVAAVWLIRTARTASSSCECVHYCAQKKKRRVRPASRTAATLKKRPIRVVEDRAIIVEQDDRLCSFVQLRKWSATKTWKQDACMHTGIRNMERCCDCSQSFSLPPVCLRISSVCKTDRSNPGLADDWLALVSLY